MTEVRDRIANPSINFPQTEEEAFQALLHSVGHALFTSGGVLNRTFTTDAGLGHTRTGEATDWLNAQQSLIRARLEDFLDELDIQNRIH